MVEVLLAFMLVMLLVLSYHLHMCYRAVQKLGQVIEQNTLTTRQLERAFSRLHIVEHPSTLHVVED